MSVITLGIADLGRSRRFYAEGFGWASIFENEEIAFYQMNGFVLGTWLQGGLEGDMQVAGLRRPGAFALAHNVGGKEEVQVLIDRLAGAGGRILRKGDAPPHGGFRGYVADPDDHAWEIAWNPAWRIDERGLVTFGI
ncbi:VOC family protein [Sphingomonas gilva]|uniref:VOC family protein n=1 Tax=Sphingomonas gilva TaxID=2305907 RepID=A0A396RJY7_9SPHN|nr:VOC family protein [Sphingomonas gilva]